MIYILLLCLFFLLCINFFFSDMDYMHPSVLFCLVFFTYTFVCLLGQKAFAISLHIESVFVIISGSIIFTIGSIISSLCNKKITPIYAKDLSYKKGEIQINPLIVYATILMQLISIFAFIKYINELAAAYGFIGNMGDKIHLYNTLTNFWTDIYAQLNVPIPMAYRILNPICNALAYLLFYVAINNYIYTKRIKKGYIIVVFLTAVLILLNGARSPLFRLLTMGILIYYVIQYGRKARHASLSFLFKIIIILLLSMIFLMVILNVIRNRNGQEQNYFKEIFIYLGAPIVNLDNYISGNISFEKTSDLFGAQTFKGLYSYIGKILHIGNLSYGGLTKFVFSNNGIEIGNVFTMYLKILYDFGFTGIIPLVGLMSWYYNSRYMHFTRFGINPNRINFSLFIYSYLFNDLIMSPFSTRFYETIFEPGFLKLLLLSFFFYEIMDFSNGFRINKFCFFFPKFVAKTKLKRSKNAGSYYNSI